MGKRSERYHKFNKVRSLKRANDLYCLIDKSKIKGKKKRNNKEGKTQC